MIKRIYIAIMALFAVTAAEAQTAGGMLAIENLVAAEADGMVAVSFDARIADRTAGRNETVAFVPVLTDGNYKVSLPAIIVEGKGKRMTAEYPAGIRTANGRTVSYVATAEAQEWMHGGKLIVEGSVNKCCAAEAIPDVVLSEHLHLYDDPEPVEIVTEVLVFKPQSVADSLSAIFPFVLPNEMFDPKDPFRIYDRERDNSMIVYFHQSRYDIDRNYLSNGHMLTNLTATVEMILADNKSRIERVVVAGFASPEGSYDFNDRLAFNRAVAVKLHLMKNTDLRDEQIWLHNGTVDWRGLRLLVERSDMPEKHQILDIIDNTPIWDNKRQVGRLGELMRLNNGDPYRQMLRELFPLLRNGAFIKVYYSNT